MTEVDAYSHDVLGKDIREACGRGDTTQSHLNEGGFTGHVKER